MLPIGCPFQRTAPALGRARPQRMRRRLVLPLPFAPATRSSSPARSTNETPRNRVRAPRSHSSSAASSMRVLLHGSANPRLEPSSNAGHVLRKLASELFEQGALLGLDLVLSHVCDEGRQEQGSAGIRQVHRPACKRQKKAEVHRIA